MTIPYFFDTNVLISFVFSDFEKTGTRSVQCATIPDNKYIGATVQREAFDSLKGLCSRYNNKILNGLHQFIDDMKLNGFNRAYLDISEEKVRYFINSLYNDPGRERRVKLAYAAMRMNYEKNIDYLKMNIICLPGIIANPRNKDLHKKIIEIFRSTTPSPNWDDAEVILEADEAGLIYKNLVFVTADYHDILIHREALLSITSLSDIVSLFD